MKIDRAKIAHISLLKPENRTENLTTLTETAAGFPPFTRGLHPRMYLQRPWTIRQYAGFSTAEESNAFYKKNLAGGQKGLSVAFDLPTHRGYDSDHPLAKADVGKAGVAIDTVEDMKQLFQDIPLDKMSVSMTMNGAVIPILAFYIVAAEEQGTALDTLKGTIQNDILKEFLVRNTYIYPPKASLNLISHIFQYTSQNMPGFNSISISGYHMQEAGATAAQELGYTLANGLEYVKLGLKAGLDIDEFAPRLSFFWGIGMDFFTEIAKLRAARTLWASLMKEFNPKNKKSLMLRTHCQTSGWSLAAQDPFNNITRTNIEAMAAVLGGTQSLHTNALDEAIALPTDFSAEIARNTQIHLQKETDLCRMVDPFAGSYIVEEKTTTLIEKAWEIIKEIDREGGMQKLIENGTIKTNIEKAATEKQARIDSGKDLIIGVNSFKDPLEPPLDLLEIDNEQIIKSQTEKLKRIKAARDERAVAHALDQISKLASRSFSDFEKDRKEGNLQWKPEENLLSLAVIAARKRATLGEISAALEKEYGRHQASQHIFSGVYSKLIHKDKTYISAQQKAAAFLQANGRRPRILLAKIGQDGHDRGIKIVATSLADMGFDVDLGPLFQTAEGVAKQAVENDVHLIGISSLAGGHKTIIKDLHNSLKKQGATSIKIVMGGIIPEKDKKELIDSGACAFFGPGSRMTETAISLLDILLE